MSTAQKATVKDHLIDSLLKAGKYDKFEQIQPVAILWPDKHKIWEPVIKTLQQDLPELLVYGERKFNYDEIKARDKNSLDIFWIRDESLADLDNLPDPDVLAEEIIENLEAGVESFKQVVQSLNGR
jgi:hypothetical protein